MSNKTLADLNDVLFDTLEKLSKDEIKPTKAKQIIDVGNAIVNNAKTQLMAFKMMKGKAMPPTVVGLPPSSHVPAQAQDTYEQKSDFAHQLGYDNVAAAIASLSKERFEKRFKEEYN